jgi:SOS-response transcriptional repressor LexA
MLTRQQSRLLDYLISRQASCAPSFEEMREHLELSSKSAVHQLVCGLESRGFVRRLGRRARAIEVIRRPGQPHSELEARIAEIASTGFKNPEAYARALGALLELARQNGVMLSIQERLAFAA